MAKGSKCHTAGLSTVARSGATSTPRASESSTALAFCNDGLASLCRLDTCRRRPQKMKPSGTNDRGAPVRRLLDALNFFLADVRGGLGPYLAVYLLAERNWDEASIGVVMSIATAAGILPHTPARALGDALRAKRVLVGGAAPPPTAGCM